MPAFQLMEQKAASGNFGTSPFGTSPFGGTAYEPYTLPAMQVPATDVSKNHWQMPGDIVHRKRGVVVGARKWARAGKWRVFHSLLEEQDLLEYAAFHEARVFWLLQDDDEQGRRVKVYWPGEFQPTPIRGGYYELDFTVEEVLG